MTEPALTAKEWANEGNVSRDGSWAYLPSGVLGVVVGHDGRPGLGLGEEIHHALAALCLHDQPFGFTHEDVRQHREQAKGVRGVLRALLAESSVRDVSIGRHLFAAQSQQAELLDRIRWHESMADRIAALLPPEE